MFVGSEKDKCLKKMVTLPFFMAILFCMMAVIQVPKTIAADLSDGTYTVEYEMLQADNDSVSIANDYFEKPATVTIDKDNQYVQFTVSRSEWVKVLKAANGDSFIDVDVVSEDPENNQRVIAFKVDGDIAEPVLMQMHVVIEDMEPAYDHNYTVRLDFDKETMQATDAPAVKVKSSGTAMVVQEQDEPASNNAFIYILVIMYILITIAIAVVFVVVRKSSSAKKAKNNTIE